MTPPSSPLRPPSPIYEWPFHPSVLEKKTCKALSTIEKVRSALERCGIVSEHAVNAIMEIIEGK